MYEESVSAQVTTALIAKKDDSVPSEVITASITTTEPGK